MHTWVWIGFHRLKAERFGFTVTRGGWINMSGSSFSRGTPDLSLTPRVHKKNPIFIKTARQDRPKAFFIMSGHNFSLGSPRPQPDATSP